MAFFSTKSPEFGSSRSVMDCRNLLLSRNCREIVKFAVVRITELGRRDDPDKILEVCSRHNLSHNPINVARLTVAGETLYDSLWKVVNSFHLASVKTKCERDGAHWRSPKIYRGDYTAARRYEFYFRMVKYCLLPRQNKIHIFKPPCNFLFELFCLQNSLIVGVQPQVSGKVGSLVGWFLGGQCSAFPTTVEFYRKASCRGRNKNADENARKILVLKRHYESVRISFA